MPANTSPIFSVTPRTSSVRITGALGTSDGTGTVGSTVFLAFTPGTNGSYLQRVRFSLAEATMGTASAATTLRVHISTANTGLLTTANTFLYQEVNAATQTPTALAASYPIDIPLNFAIPSNQYIIVSTSTTNTASTAWIATVIGGDY
jgi:hypothetical protein